MLLVIPIGVSKNLASILTFSQVLIDRIRHVGRTDSHTGFKQFSCNSLSLMVIMVQNAFPWNWKRIDFLDDLLQTATGPIKSWGILWDLSYDKCY